MSKIIKVEVINNGGEYAYGVIENQEHCDIFREAIAEEVEIQAVGNYFEG